MILYSSRITLSSLLLVLFTSEYQTSRSPAVSRPHTLLLICCLSDPSSFLCGHVTLQPRPLSFLRKWSARKPSPLAVQSLSDLLTSPPVSPTTLIPPVSLFLFDWPRLFDSDSFISTLCCDWSIFRSSKLGLVSVADLYSDWLFVVCVTFNLQIKMFSVGELCVLNCALCGILIPQLQTERWIEL